MDKKVKRVSSNLIWGFINKIVLIGFPFVIRTLMLHKLGKLYIGLDSLFSSLLQVLCLADLGLSSAIVYSLYEPVAKEDYESAGGILNFYRKVYRYIGLFIFLMGILLLPFLNYLIAGEYPSGINIYIVYVVQLLNVSLSYWLFAYKNALLTALQRVDIESKIRLVINIFQYSVQIIVLLITSNYYLYIIGFPIFTVLLNITRNKVVNKRFSSYLVRASIDIKEKKIIISKVKALFIYKIGGVILRYADQIVISAFLGLGLLGQYSNYYYIISTLIGILAIYYNSVRPVIGNAFIKDDIETTKKLFMKLQLFQNWIVGWWSICIVCLIQDFVSLWAGKGYILDSYVSVLFAIYFYTWKIQDNVYIFKEATGLWDKDKIRPFISTLLNIILNLILVQFIGIYGILISTIIAVLLVDLPWSARVFFKEFYVEMELQYYISLLLSTVITFIIGYITYRICCLFSCVTWSMFVFKTVICIVVPNIFYFLIYVWKKQKRGNV